MPTSAGYLEFIKEQFSDFGPVTVRRMFGGAGIFSDGLMFALIADETLYLKADSVSQSDFEAFNLPPFTYTAKGEKKIVMAYWRAPETCLDDRDEMTLWARKAFAAALRARKPAKAPKVRKSLRKPQSLRLARKPTVRSRA
jgi:DNA transformation protein and related proteins